MHHSRLVGGFTALAVLLILIVAPVALATTADLPPANPKAVTIAHDLPRRARRRRWHHAKPGSTRPGSPSSCTRDSACGRRAAT